MSTTPSRTVKPNKEEIKRLRLARGWNQAKLAEAAVLALNTIRRIEKGIPCFPTKMAKIARAFGLPDCESIIVRPNEETGGDTIVKTQTKSFTVTYPDGMTADELIDRLVQKLDGKVPPDDLLEIEGEDEDA